MSGFFRNLFGKSEDREPARDVAALVDPLAQPAVHLVLSETPSASQFGGSVRLPAGVAWPTRGGRRLSLLARIALIELHRALVIPWLPRNGTLLFFYDLDAQPWGFDTEDRGGCTVIHVPDHAIASEDREGEDGVIEASSVAFRAIRSLPSGDRASVEALQLTDDESDALGDLTESLYEDSPQHQIGGYPSPVQGDIMELEAELVTHGIACGEPSAYESARAMELAPGASKWKLLLQLDTDDDLDVMWGDDGKLYFWVEEERARAGDFTNVWLILQCG